MSDLASVTGDTDLGSDDGRFLARILGAVASKESDDKSRRVRRKHDELALAGKLSGGGSHPFGYEDDRITIRAGEAAVVCECAERFLAGESLRSICADLNARGIATVGVGEWAPQTLRRMLMSGRISGQREHKGEIVARGEWPAIITPTQTGKIRARLADPDRRTSKSARRYLLVRLLRCGLCGGTLVSRPRTGGQRRHACAKGPGLSGCGRVYINADPWKRSSWRLSSTGSTAPSCRRVDWQAGRAGRRPLPARGRPGQAQLAELAEANGNKLIGMPEWLAARTPIERRLTAARKQLAKVSRVSVLDGNIGKSTGLRERWEPST